MISLVSTSTAAVPLAWNLQRGAFHAKGRVWVFYTDGTNEVYRTSKNFTTWTAAVTVIATTYGAEFCVFFDGVYVHYASYRNNVLYYRRGTPGADGTITWSDGEQTVLEATLHFPSIAVTSSGYPVIGYLLSNEPYAILSSANDGTWATAADFPYKLHTQEDSESYCCNVVPLTSDKFYTVYGCTGGNLYGRLYDAGWGDEETIDDILYNYHDWSTVSWGDTVGVVWLDTGEDIKYRERAAGGAWGDEVGIADNVGDNDPSLSLMNSAGDLYAFWPNLTTSHLYYRVRIRGVWRTAVDWADESTEGIATSLPTNSFFMRRGHAVGYVYRTLSESPYNVKFNYILVGPFPTFFRPT